MRPFPHYSVRHRNAALPPLSYVGGFVSTTNYLNASPGVAGSGAHTFYVAFIHRASTVSAAIACKGNAVTPSTAGWGFRKSSAGLTDFRVRDGVGAKSSPGFTVGAGDIGKVFLIHGVIDITANNIIRLYNKGAQVGSGTATSGAFVSSANAMGVGSRNGGADNMSSDLDIVAFGAVDLVMSGAEIAAHYAAAVAAQKVSIPAVGYGVGFNWSAEDYAAPWPDEIAASGLTTTGSLSTGTIATPTWA